LQFQCFFTPQSGHDSLAGKKDDSFQSIDSLIYAKTRIKRP
jgi:hypothetical protein